MPLKVLHIPKYDNPYQKLLIDHLRKAGIKAEFGAFFQYFSFLNLSLVFNLLKNRNVDVIHLHWHHKFLLGGNAIESTFKSLMFLLQVVVVRLLGVKLVWTVHNLKNHENRQQRLELFFSSLLGRLANAVIAHCDSAKAIIRETLNIPARKIFVTAHGHFSSAYKNIVSREAARRRLNIKNDDFVFLFFGKIRQYKGLDQLVQSFTRLEGQNLKLLIAGQPHDAPTRDHLTQITRGHDNIAIFDRYIPDDDIQLFMNAADILVLPYLDILTSGTAILGMTFAKPVIAPDIGCVPDIINSEGGFLYNPNRQTDLGRAMQNAIKSKALLSRMGERNNRFTHTLGWREIALQTKTIYEQC